MEGQEWKRHRVVDYRHLTGGISRGEDGVAKTANTDQADAYRMTAEEVVAELGSDERRGLGGQEAAARLQRYGPNELETEKPVPAWRRFLAQFQDVLIILLLIATAISVGLWVYERDTALPYEGLTIFAIVLLNGILGYVQETRAERAVAALRAMSANEATVLRDSERQSVPAAEQVPGDVVLIEEGDTIPADARLTGSTALQTMEASLTGESLPVSKDVAPLEEGAGLGDRHNVVFSGAGTARSPRTPAPGARRAGQRSSSVPRRSGRCPRPACAGWRSSSSGLQHRASLWHRGPSCQGGRHPSRSLRSCRERRPLARTRPP